MARFGLYRKHPSQDAFIAFDKIYLAEVLEDVRKARPGIKTSKADLYASRSEHRHGGRWMEFTFEGFKYSGYHNTAYEGRAKGWEEWLKAQGYEK
jgi:hypothetical protein